MAWTHVEDDLFPLVGGQVHGLDVAQNVSTILLVAWIPACQQPELVAGHHSLCRNPHLHPREAGCEQVLYLSSKCGRLARWSALLCHTIEQAYSRGQVPYTIPLDEVQVRTAAVSRIPRC